MMQIFTRNLGWKVASLFIAVALWIAVVREPELATSLSVPIEFKGIPDDLDISSNVPDRVRLELRGPSGRLSRDYLSDLAVILDLSDARPGERTYNVRPANINLPSGVDFYRAIPSQITLRFDKLLTREVEIALGPLAKGPPEGYHVRSYSIQPLKTRVRGPEQLVRNITRVSIDPVDLSGVVSQAEFHTHVNVGDPQVRLEAPADVILKITLEKTNPKDTKK
jgi:YbbR domain-containing protein